VVTPHSIVDAVRHRATPMELDVGCGRRLSLRAPTREASTRWRDGAPLFVLESMAPIDVCPSRTSPGVRCSSDGAACRADGSPMAPGAFAAR
jgi:hypothetical protein